MKSIGVRRRWAIGAGVLAVVGAGIGVIAVGSAAQAYNGCHSEALVSFTYDQAYVRATVSGCTNVGFYHSYQPPSSGIYSTPLSVKINPTIGVAYADAVRVQLVWANACSSASTFNCNNKNSGYSSNLYAAVWTQHD